MARKVSQIIARGDRRWLIRVYLGRDRETNKRNYHNRTIHGPMREAQAYLTRKLGERDLGRDLEAAKITLNLAKHFRSLLNLVGLPRIRLYDLRHSAAPGGRSVAKSCLRAVRTCEHVNNRMRQPASISFVKFEI
jgi:hypothetical protein